MSKPIRTVELTVEASEYEERALFLRSVRAEGEAEDGRKIEVAINELGAGIIIRVGNRQFVITEHQLIDAVLNKIDRHLSE